MCCYKAKSCNSFLVPIKSIVLGKITNSHKTRYKMVTPTWFGTFWIARQRKKLFITTPFDLLHLQPPYYFQQALARILPHPERKRHNVDTHTLHPFPRLPTTKTSNITKINLLITNTALRTLINPTKETKTAKHPEKFSNIPPNYLQGLSKQGGIFFQQNYQHIFFYFLTRKIGNFNFHSPYSYFVFYSNVGYLSHHLTKTYSDCYQFQRTQNKNSHYSSEVHCYSCMPISRLMNFFLSDILFFKKKNVPLGAQKKN